MAATQRSSSSRRDIRCREANPATAACSAGMRARAAVSRSAAGRNDQIAHSVGRVITRGVGGYWRGGRRGCDRGLRSRSGQGSGQEQHDDGPRFLLSGTMRSFSAMPACTPCNATSRFRIPPGSAAGASSNGTTRRRRRWPSGNAATAFPWARRDRGGLPNARGAPCRDRSHHGDG